LFSVLPHEGVCVARVLRALWQAQQNRSAEAAAETTASADAGAAPASPAEEAATPTAAAAATAPAPFSPVFQIAIIPEQQQQQPSSWRSSPGRLGAEGGSKGPRGQSSTAGRVTVLHLLEVSPLLASCLTSIQGRVQAISGGEQLHQLLKAVMLRNRMYADRSGGKALRSRT
jgi:hypothetical protein